METILYNTAEKISLIKNNDFVTSEGKISSREGRGISVSRSSFAYRLGKKYSVNDAFDIVVKNLLLNMNPAGGGEGFYVGSSSIDITGKIISVIPGGISHDSIADVSANDHHNQSHVLTGVDHTASGLTIGHIIRATGATTFAWAQLQHGDLGGVTSNQHHSEGHVLGTSGPHTGSLPLADLAPGTAGDIITRQAADWAVLAKGAEDYVLKMGATYPEWAVPTPAVHALGGTKHSADTLANLNSKISDATLYKWENDQGATNLHGNNVVYGSAASTACVGNDSRLTNKREPAAHAMDSTTYHTSTDITVLNATTDKH